MVYSMGMNFIKSIQHSPKECAEKYKIMNPPTDIKELTALKDMWIDPDKEKIFKGHFKRDIFIIHKGYVFTWSPLNPNEITIEGEHYDFNFTIHKRFLIEITGICPQYYK